MGALIARIDRGAGGVTDSAIDAMGDRLTVGGAWTIPTVRGDVAGLLNTAGSAITDAYRYDPFGVSLNTQGTSVNPYRFQGRLLESTSGQYDFGARQYDPAIGAFTSLDTVMGQAQNPLSLNRYLYAHANPGVLIDLDGHRATEYDGIGKRYENAVADARAAVTAARTALTAAASAYGWATAAANYARGRLSQLCPLSQCRDVQDRAEWRQSHLDAYAAAVTVRDAARARYDAAQSAYRSAEAHLRAAVAQVSRSAKSKPSVSDSKKRAAPSRSSPTIQADDGGIIGGIGGVIGGAATAAWDFGTSALVGAADLALCAVPIKGLGCSPATLASSLATDWDGTTTAIAHSTAQAIGTARGDLVSGDPYRVSHGVTGVFLTVGTLGLGGALKIGSVGRASSVLTPDAILANPSTLAGMGPAQVEAAIGGSAGWRIEALARGQHAGQGWVLRQYAEAGNPTGSLIRWHPGGGRHGPDPYWRVSSSAGGKSDIVPGGFE